MANLLKLAVLFFMFGLFVSCDYFEKRSSCPDDSKNLGNNLKFGIYRGEQKNVVIADETNRELRVPAKETLFLYEDSTFAYFAIANNYNNDTIKKVLNGRFKIYQDAGFPWYVFELKSDSVYEKVKIGSTAGDYFSYTDKLRYSEDFIISKRSITSAYYKSVEGNLLSDVDNKSGCFSLAYKVNPHKDDWCDPDWEDCCDRIILAKNKTLCLEQSKDTQTNSTGEKK
jgi:hypothetical protein